MSADTIEKIVFETLQATVAPLGWNDCDDPITFEFEILERLDSMDMVNFLLDLQEALRLRAGVSLPLESQNFLAKDTSPCVSVKALVNFIEAL